jgi:uncharacterized protein
MDPVEILSRFYAPQSRAFRIVKAHGEQVAAKALGCAAAVPHLAPDLDFIAGAAMLHDIGIFLTHSPGLDCHGTEPYIRHGVLGRQIMDRIGYPRHGLVCERHVGAGIRAGDIRSAALPLPERDMLPVTIEEQIICYADKFFSKNGGGSCREKTIAEISAELRSHGEAAVTRFMAWHARFERHAVAEGAR